MATSGELIAATALALGIQEPTALNHFRALRGRGLVPVAGRGLNGARMGVREGATLLLVSAGSARTGETLATLEAYHALPPQGACHVAFGRDAATSERAGVLATVSDLLGFALDGEPTLGHALEGILRATVEGRLDHARVGDAARRLGSVEPTEGWAAWGKTAYPAVASVRLFSPCPAATVTVTLPGIASVTVAYGLPMFDGDCTRVPTVDARLDGELVVTRSFGMRAFHTVAVGLRH